MFEKFAELFPVLVLWTCVVALAVLVSVAFCRLLKQFGVFARLAAMRETFASLPRPQQVLAALCIAPLVVGFVGYASVKNDGGGTNDAPSRMSAPRRMLRSLAEGWLIPATPVTPAEIAAGWRAPAEGAAGRMPPPERAVTNELWRLRGAHDNAFRPELPGWRFPVRDGVLTGLTVLARGEIRPDVGALYFPVPLTNGLSLLPQARWGLLACAPGTGAQASVFWHAQSPSNSLLLTWENALVGRDPDCPTNLQVELYADGRFAWRTDDASRLYLPVLGFDWDGDGLENSVDPDPLVAGPDAHGTNAEWYRVVCSNVFAAVDILPGSESNNTDNPNNQVILPGGVAFRPEANDGAYYFVDVVAEQGPAPVYFNADRDSRLGSPVVVARAGETNHVPLLIGVEYSVTSMVPFSVSTPVDGFVVATSNNECSVTVKWPLDFTFVEDSDTPGAYTIEVVPYDPGVTFTWSSSASGGRASRRMVAPLSVSSCSCWGGSGPSVVFDCSDHCDCGGGCRAEGTGSLEDAEFTVAGGECFCSRPDEPHEDMPPLPDPLVGGLSIAFSKGAVIFEDTYTNAPGDVVMRQSTTTRLTVSASGGPFGGTFTLTTRNLEKLIVADGPGPVFLTPGMTLRPYETYSVTFECAGIAASGSANDVEVEGSFTENVTGWIESPHAQATVVEVELKSKNTPPANPCPNRHVFGVFEKVELKHRPSSEAVIWEMSGGGEINTSEEGFVGEDWGDADWMLRCPLYAKAIGLKAKCGGVEWLFNVTVLEPSGIRVQDPVRYDVFPRNVAGAGMHVPQYILPDTVDFQEISIQEIPVMNEPPINSGWFTNLPSYYQTHTDIAGAGVWNTPDERGFLGNDHVGLNCGSQIPLSPGWQYLRIPWGWNKQVKDYLSKEDTRIECIMLNNQQVYSGGECYRQVPTRYDGYDEIFADGTVSVSRFGLRCSRPLNGDHSVTNLSAQGGN